MRVKIEKVEAVLNKRIKPNQTALGVDVAKISTGFCLLETTNKYLTVVLTETLTVKTIEKGKKKTLHQHLDELTSKAIVLREKIQTKYGLKKLDTIILEDCFFGSSVLVTKLLAKAEVIFYLAFRKMSENIPDPIQPRSARSKIGFKKDRTTKRKIKLQVQDYLKENFNFTFDNDNESDAFVLALVGLIQ